MKGCPDYLPSPQLNESALTRLDICKDKITCFTGRSSQKTGQGLEHISARNRNDP